MNETNKAIAREARQVLTEMFGFPFDGDTEHCDKIESVFLRAITKAEEGRKTYEQRVIELFSSWLDHWSIRVNRQACEVYGAWDQVRELARKENP